jgi:SAM-dependent methyltransferase
LEKFRSFDRFVQLAHSEKKYTYQEALELFYDSIKGYPEDYQKKAREATKEGYVDVYHHDGKRSGAYSSGGSDIHPFILLNFEGGLDDVFTLAHESGHSVHTLYSMEAQPIVKQGYTIFVAEIASTFNEHNLVDYLLKKGTLAKEDKIFLLQKMIDEICSTFYRQTLFAHYEYEVSLLAEKGSPINYQVLSSVMIKLYKQYYGIDISEEMLGIAQRKELLRRHPELRSENDIEPEKAEASPTRPDILYLLQDMRAFELYGTVRAVVSVCDSLNYITEEEDLLQVFRLVNNYLDPKGLFLFDLNTVSHYRDLCADNTFAESRDDCSFIWENDYDSVSGINEYDLTLFLRREDGLYERFFETHREKAWETETVRAILEEAGMRYMGALEAYTDAPASDGSDRVLICAAEQGK